MSDKQGSDELFARYGDVGAIGRGARADGARRALEEWRVRAMSPAEDEPGQDHPDPDETPPADGRPEFDPLPPAWR